MNPARLRKLRGGEIGMIFQEPMTALNPTWTCGAQVTEALELHTTLDAASRKARAIELFNQVGIPQPQTRFDQYPHELSGGMRQRICISIALACGPQLLIADEPTTALDVTIQAQILDLIKRLQRERGMAVLFITHDLGVVAELADRVILMRHGQVVEQGPVAEIFANPKHPYTKGLLACRPRLGVKRDRLPTVDDFMAAGS
jgi:peptide/nickel transport system ATP-binding protein